MNFTPWTRNMRERIWYYPPAGNDGMGGLIYGLPEERLCRWQDGTNLVRDAQGREVPSSATVYLNLAVVAEGVLLRGDVDYPEETPPTTAKRIITTQDSPSLDQTRVLYKAMVE